MRLMMMILMVWLVAKPALAQQRPQETLHAAGSTLAKLSYAMTLAEQCNLRDLDWWTRTSTRLTNLQVSMGRRFPDALPGGAQAAQAYLMGVTSSAGMLAGHNIGWNEHQACDWVRGSRELQQLDQMAGRR